MTSSPSRAWVHSDCSVYIALPSACRLSTGRSGHATAAPVATGIPKPIEPPVSVSQSWGGQPAVAGDAQIPPVCASSTTIASSASVAPTASATAWRGERAGRAARAGTRAARRARRRGRAEPVGELGDGGDAALGDVGEHVHLAAVGHEVAGLAGVGEERHRRLRADEDEVAQPGELRRRELGEVAEPLDRRDARAAPDAGREHLGEDLGAGGGRDRVGEREGRLVAHGVVAEEERRGLAAREHLGRDGDGLGLGRERRGERAAGRPRRRRRTTTRRRAGSAWRSRPGASAPRRRPRRRRRRAARGRLDRRIQPDTFAASVSMSLSSGASYCLWYVAWSPTMFTIGVCARPGVVQVGDAVAEAGAEVQQRRRRAGRSCGRSRRPRR